MATWQTLEWEDIESLADRAFKWGVGDGITWAKWMWKYLSQGHLTRYCTELDRCRVKVYVLALADLYNEFCWMAYQEPQDEEYCDWAAALELPALRIGQLIGDDADFAADETDEQSLTQAALMELMQEARSLMLPGLAQLGGGPMGLLKGLYGCSQYLCEDESAINAVNVDLSLEKLTVYTWLEGEVAAAEVTMRPPTLSLQPQETSALSHAQLSLSI